MRGLLGVSREHHVGVLILVAKAAKTIHVVDMNREVASSPTSTALCLLCISTFSLHVD